MTLDSGDGGQRSAARGPHARTSGPRGLRANGPLVWGRLLRLSLLPSAAADSAGGIALATAGWPGGGAPWLAIAGSISVYAGGLVLNDWADRAHDARTRPDRPLPSGGVAPGAALALAALLLALGPLLGLAASPITGAILAAVAALAAIYDLVGRGPWRGPLLLGACRALNLSSGIATGLALAPDARLDPLLAAPPILYGAYVISVGRLGRMEDAEDAGAIGTRPARFLWTAFACLLWAGCPPWNRNEGWQGWIPMLLSLAGAIALGKLANSAEPWTQGRVLAAMGVALRRLVLFGAICAALPGTSASLAVAGAILLLVPLGYALRRLFPPS